MVIFQKAKCGKLAKTDSRSVVSLAKIRGGNQPNHEIYKNEGGESPVKICSNATALFQRDGRECQSTWY
ncbi:hypothetical protein VB713_17530 [Anabaena cylindrica UHCC 0172]|nr:hypothetical protein [Anabaena cylindrica UHCC 0172]